MNWYDWNKGSQEYKEAWALVGIDLHELIRLKHDFFSSLALLLAAVGIDLHELIRLKLNRTLQHQQRSLHVGIDLHELIRLKHDWYNGFLYYLYGSGLICMNWYDWNLSVSILFTPSHCRSGLICMNWYDWNIYCSFVRACWVKLSGLICMNWYDWNHPEVTPVFAVLL